MFALLLGLSPLARAADKAVLSAPFLPLPPGLVVLNSAEGRALMSESLAASFWSLIKYYSTQPDLGSCSVASCTMVLNALPISRPVAPKYGEFKLFTPENFFTPAVSAIKSREAVSASGMSLAELAEALETYPVEITRVYAQPGSGQVFRDSVRAALKGSNQFVLVNYLRRALGQQTGGHISPLGAYHEGRDMVLILDVSNYKYPWVWVRLDELYHAMELVDPDSDVGRGYLLVSAKKQGVDSNHSPGSEPTPVQGAEGNRGSR